MLYETEHEQMKLLKKELEKMNPDYLYITTNVGHLKKESELLTIGEHTIDLDWKTSKEGGRVTSIDIYHEFWLKQIKTEYANIDVQKRIQEKDEYEDEEWYELYIYYYREDEDNVNIKIKFRND